MCPLRTATTMKTGPWRALPDRPKQSFSLRDQISQLAVSNAALPVIRFETVAVSSRPIAGAAIFDLPPPNRPFRPAFGGQQCDDSFDGRRGLIVSMLSCLLGSTSLCNSQNDRGYRHQRGHTVSSKASTSTALLPNFCAHLARP